MDITYEFLQISVICLDDFAQPSFADRPKVTKNPDYLELKSKKIIPINKFSVLLHKGKLRVADGETKICASRSPGIKVVQDKEVKWFIHNVLQAFIDTRISNVPNSKKS